MPKTKISEFSATPASNTDIDSINIAEGCAPSGINDAIRELMAQLKDFQTGAVGDSFNGPVGTTTAAAGAFTTLSSTGNTTLGDASGDSVTINGTATFANANPVLSAGTANGVAYLNGSKVLTSGSALTFDGTNLTVGTGTNQLQAKPKAILFYNTGISDALIQSADDSSTVTSIALNKTELKFYSSGSEGMRLTSTGLGIGTSSPAGKLDVRGNSASSYIIDTTSGSAVLSALYLGVPAVTTYAGLVTDYANDRLYFRHNSATRMTLDSSGNLGLGVTPSAWDSTYKAFQSTTSALASASGDVKLLQNAYYDGGWKYIATQAASMYSQASGAHNWRYAASGTAGNAITFTQAMTLDASGRLGVGTTSPSSYGGWISVDIRGSNGGQLIVANSAATNIGEIFTDSNGFNVSARTNNAMLFKTNDAERARIDSSGNLLVGLTTAAAGSASTVYKNQDSTWTWRVESGATSLPNGILVKYSGTSPNNTGSQFIYCQDSGDAERMSVRSNGGIANYSGNNVNLSDRREKTNISPASSYLDKICAIPVQTFNYIDQNLEEDGGLTLGVVAQDVQAVAPELVMESNWGTDKAPKMRLSIYQTDLQYALMKALQELKAEFDAYKASHP